VLDAPPDVAVGRDGVDGALESLFTRAQQDAFLAAVPAARLKVYQETGHCPNWERPEWVAADIADFVASAARGSCNWPRLIRPVASRTTGMAVGHDPLPRHRLSPDELAEFYAWFLEHDWAAWDRQLERDVQNGKLDALADQALRDHAAGKTTRL
jgi:hypothetical protein